jgi:hypothetical protein
MAGFVKFAKIERVRSLDLERHGFFKRAWLKILPVVRFRLLDDLFYVDSNDIVHRVKAGFISDLGSIPRILWFMFPPMNWISSYILHDFDCENEDTPRWEGDDRLLESLLSNGAPEWRAYAIYGGVRLYALLFGIR